MTIKEFIKTLKKHKVDFDKDLAIAFNEDDGEDFSIEEGDYTVFLVKSEWGKEINHHFLDEEKKKGIG